MSLYMNYLVQKLGYSSYNEYLKSEHWAVFSSGMRQKQCFCCYKTTNLQIHHNCYDRIGEELPADVVTVCGGCHIGIHELAKDGVPLLDAHNIYRKKMGWSPPKEKNKPKKWVHLFGLLNKSKHETVDHLIQFLIRKELSDGQKATGKAFKLSYVKMVNGKEKWNVKKYINLMMGDRKLQKKQAKGLPISKAVRKFSQPNG